MGAVEPTPVRLGAEPRTLKPLDYLGEHVPRIGHSFVVADLLVMRVGAGAEDNASNRSPAPALVIIFIRLHCSMSRADMAECAAMSPYVCCQLT
uniref:Uncharacterized protein n=1 Tax=Oryza sativa subsp. japonica TaxID=39947 RepID=Q8W3A7_ORYSJ|nr:hypothetical protein [Oryza sativa Japonica Group]